MLCTALRLLLYGLVSGVGANKESVHTFSRRQIVCTMIFILCAIIMLQAGILYRLWQQRRQAELLARNRLRYIEEWLDLLYLYNNDPVSFHTRCKELASVKRLSNYHIVNDSLRVRLSKTSPEQLDTGRKGISMSDGSGILESGIMCYFPGRKGRVDLRETSPDKSKDRKCE